LGLGLGFVRGPMMGVTRPLVGVPRRLVRPTGLTVIAKSRSGVLGRRFGLVIGITGDGGMRVIAGDRASKRGGALSRSPGGARCSGIVLLIAPVSTRIGGRGFRVATGVLMRARRCFMPQRGMIVGVSTGLGFGTGLHRCCSYNLL